MKATIKLTTALAILGAVAITSAQAQVSSRFVSDDEAQLMTKDLRSGSVRTNTASYDIRALPSRFGEGRYSVTSSACDIDPGDMFNDENRDRANSESLRHC